MSRAIANGTLTLEADGPIARLTLDRPAARNALTHAMWLGLAEVASELESTAGVKALIITGAGDRAFSAGADIGEFPQTYATPEATQAYNKAVRRAQRAIADLSMPVIAEIRGACIGGGCGLALHCDLRFAADTATFAITPSRLGLAYSFEDTHRLVSAVGAARAKDILFSGRILTADEALQCGLIEFLRPEGELSDAVTEYASRLADLSQSSIRVAKATIGAVALGDAHASDDLRRAFEETFTSDDFAEGYAAFIEKRKPDFG